jgi:hypothetical protein
VYNSDLFVNTSAFNSSSTLNASSVANPCGLIAYTVFNDTFNLYDPSNNLLAISAKGIAWPTDIERYQAVDTNNMWYNTTD